MPQASGRARTAPTGRAHIYVHPPRGAVAALLSRLWAKEERPQLSLRAFRNVIPDMAYSATRLP